MKTRLRKSLILVSGFCLLFMALGCAPITKTVHPQFEMRIKDIKTTGLLSPDIKIFEFTAGGMRELRDDWCSIGKENVARALMECLKGTPMEINSVTMDKEMEEEMADVYALYRAVSNSINLHTQVGEHRFPGKVKDFDYSIGSMEEILKKYGGDALIFVSGFDEISTAGRQTLKAVGIVAGIALAAAGVGGAMIIPRSGITLVSVALVDSSGTILWYNIKANQGGYDLRKPESTSEFVREVLSNYPGVKK